MTDERDTCQNRIEVLETELREACEEYDRLTAEVQRINGLLTEHGIATGTAKGIIIYPGEQVLSPAVREAIGQPVLDALDAADPSPVNVTVTTGGLLRVVAGPPSKTYKLATEEKATAPDWMPEGIEITSMRWEWGKRCGDCRKWWEGEADPDPDDDDRQEWRSVTCSLDCSCACEDRRCDRPDEFEPKGGDDEDSR